MGWASERAIEIHNESMAFDKEYAEEYFRQEAEYQAWADWREKQMERETDWFPDFRLAHDGYTEIDVPKPSTGLSNEDLPF